jgi:hypothetical protein
VEHDIDIVAAPHIGQEVGHGDRRFAVKQGQVHRALRRLDADHGVLRVDGAGDAQEGAGQEGTAAGGKQDAEIHEDDQDRNSTSLHSA